MERITDTTTTTRLDSSRPVNTKPTIDYLPIEVERTIVIDFLSTFPLLPPLCLVRKSWTDLLLPKLYTNIWLAVGASKSDTLHLLARTLVGNHTLAGMVKSLKLLIVGLDNSGQDLATIAGSVNDLQTLKVEAEGQDMLRTRQDSFPSVVPSLRRFTTIRQFHLDTSSGMVSLHDLGSILGNFKLLQDLRLEFLTSRTVPANVIRRANDDGVVDEEEESLPLTSWPKPTYQLKKLFLNMVFMSPGGEDELDWILGLTSELEWLSISLFSHASTLLKRIGANTSKVSITRWAIFDQPTEEERISRIVSGLKYCKRVSHLCLHANDIGTIPQIVFEINQSLTCLILIGISSSPSYSTTSAASASSSSSSDRTRTEPLKIILDLCQTKQFPWLATVVVIINANAHQEYEGELFVRELEELKMKFGLEGVELDLKYGNHDPIKFF